jgi:hypothetical protein
MTPTIRKTALAACLTFILLASAPEALAQRVVVSEYCPPTVLYYYPARSVVYYPTTVRYCRPPPVSFYSVPTVSYYAPPTVSYYSVPVMSTTTRYGPFGRPRVSTSYYYPVYVRP